LRGQGRRVAAGEGEEQGGTWTEPSERWRRSAAPPAWTRAVWLAAASTLRSGARSGGVAETERQPLRERERERSEGRPGERPKFSMAVRMSPGRCPERARALSGRRPLAGGGGAQSRMYGTFRSFF